MTVRERIRFYQQMAVLMRAGVPIRTSLERLKAKAAEVAKLADQLNAGERIGDAFTSAGFSPFECHLVIAGEKSAQLDTVFEHLSEYWKRELEMRQALVRPLYYPIVVLHLVVVLGAVIEYVATSSQTATIIHLVERLAALYAGGFVLYTLARVSWSSPLMRTFWLYVPIIGGSLRSTYAYRWISALRLEFTAGVSLSRAVGDAWRASGDVNCERLATEGEESMRNGVKLSDLMRQWTRFPRDWIDFIETGEISGALEAAFRNLEQEAARTWRLAQERLASGLPKIIYFVVIIFVAVQVGQLMYKVEVQPIIDTEKVIDDATK